MEPTKQKNIMYQQDTLWDQVVVTQPTLNCPHRSEVPSTANKRIIRKSMMNDCETKNRGRKATQPTLTYFTTAQEYCMHMLPPAKLKKIPTMTDSMERECCSKLNLRALIESFS